MLGNAQFYNRTIRKVVVAFGTMFNDILLQRYSVDGTTKQELFKVPLTYGSKEKYITRITSDPDLFYNKFEYKNNDTNKIESVKSGFWSNSSLILKFSMPFTKWYQENSLRNTVLSDQMKYLDSKGLVDQQYQKLIEKLKLLK